MFSYPALAFLPMYSTESSSSDPTVWKQNQDAQTASDVVGSNAIGQRLQVTSSFVLDSIEIEIALVSGSPTWECRSGTDSDLTTYDEAWTGLAPEDSTTLVLTSVENDSYSSGYVYFACLETAGGGDYARMSRSGDSSDPTMEANDKQMDDNGSAWVLGSATTNDVRFVVKKQ